MPIYFEPIYGALQQIFKLAIVVIPLMAVLELSREYGILNVLVRLTKPLTKMFKIQEESAFPLLVGLTFGLSFGAGVIIQSAHDGALNRRSLLLVTLFLACCHAVVEDTLIFVQVGANGWLLIGLRVTFAMTTTFILSRILPQKAYDLAVKGDLDETHSH